MEEWYLFCFPALTARGWICCCIIPARDAACCRSIQKENSGGIWRVVFRFFFGPLLLYQSDHTERWTIFEERLYVSQISKLTYTSRSICPPLLKELFLHCWIKAWTEQNVRIELKQKQHMVLRTLKITGYKWVTALVSKALSLLFIGWVEISSNLSNNFLW